MTFYKSIVSGFATLLCICFHNSAGFSQQAQVYRDVVEPNWFASNDGFWYRVKTSAEAWEFVLVDANAGTRKAAFDHDRVAKLLSDATSTNIASTKLPIEQLEFSEDKTHVIIKCKLGSWNLNLATYELDRIESPTAANSTTRFFLPPRKSIDKGGDVEFEVANQSDKAIELVWIGRDSTPKTYQTIQPGKKTIQHTFAGHVWLVKYVNGADIAAFEVGERTSEVTVDPAAITESLKQQSRSRADGERRSGSRRSSITKSPNGRYTAFVRDENLWLTTQPEDGDSAASTERQLSTDAIVSNTFQKDASRSRLVEMQYTLQDPPVTEPDVRWSPDSSRVLAFQTKKVSEPRVWYIDSSPKDQLQPKLESYPYAKPGAPLPISSPRLFNTQDGTETPISNELFNNPFKLQFLKWSEDGDHFYLFYNQRGHQALRVLKVSASDGSVSAIVDETSETFIHYSTSGKFVMEWLPNDELLWASERSGWNHLYRYNVKTGQVINSVTTGNWNVKKIEHIDTAAEVIWFYAVGIVSGQDPYHEHFCKVNFDGSGFKILTEGDGTHSVTMSPDRRMFLDRYSRVDLAAVTELRSSDDGSLITTLETGDASALVAARGSLPIRFTAKGRDGETDIWGIIHLPKYFDANRQYPVVENIYAGPHDHHVPKAFRSTYRHQHQISDRGMIVVQIDGMGTAWRSKEFHDVCFRNLRDAGFPDRIAWMKAAAAKFPWMDISKVGIYGGSAGGQNAMGAVLWHGTFYKAAVADCGCHDNRMDKLWWNEQWMGWPVDDHYATNSNVENAHLLQGHLMLVVGELDRNVDPASTTQVVSALTKAGKNFDFLLLAGSGHGACESQYGSRRRADFLATHLGARDKD